MRKAAPARPTQEELPTDNYASRQVMWYRDEEGSKVAIVWEEWQYRRLGNTPEPVKLLKCFHVLYVSSSTMGVIHQEVPPREAHCFAPIQALARLCDAERYMRERLGRFGGTHECWRLLGLQPPAQAVAPASAESGERLEELYKRAARLLGFLESDLREKYGHLNPGLQAMNLRNRLRSKGHNV